MLSPNLDGAYVFASGLIREKNWYGFEGMEQARTKKEPKQAIPTFAETVELLMKVLNLLCFDKITPQITNMNRAFRRRTVMFCSMSTSRFTMSRRDFSRSWIR